VTVITFIKENFQQKKIKCVHDFKNRWFMYTWWYEYEMINRVIIQVYTYLKWDGVNEMKYEMVYEMKRMLNAR